MNVEDEKKTKLTYLPDFSAPERDAFFSRAKGLFCLALLKDA